MTARFFSIFLIIFLTACASSPDKPGKPLYWPSAPETPRLVFEASLRNSASVQIPDAENKFQQVVDNAPAEVRQWLIKPYDIAANNGIIVVTDTILSAVHVFDLPRKKMFALGWRGEGRLMKPLGVAMDDESNIYVVDAALKRVVVYDFQGHFLRTIGEPSQFSRITDVAVSTTEKQVYVLDRGGVESAQHNYLIFGFDGELKKTVGSRGHRDGEFNHPNQLAAGRDGRVYVLDAGNFRVQVFDAEGSYLYQWGRLGKGLGNLARPRGLAVNTADQVFVSDSAFQNFQIFTAEGQLLMSVGQGGGPDLPARYLLPAGIAADETGRVYIVDQMRQKIDVFRLLTSAEIEQLVN